MDEEEVREDINVRFLCFETHQQLKYWFRKILEYLRKAMPDLIWRINVNEKIDFGTQRWMFMTEHDYVRRGIGYGNIPTYRYTHLLLENDFEKTLITIVRGE